MCCCHPSFLFCTIIIFCSLTLAGIFTRIAYGITDKIAQAPFLDLLVSLFTWLPWVAGWWMLGWRGVIASVIAQLVFLHAFCLIHRALRGKKGRTLTDAQGKVLGPFLGPFRNQLCLMVQTPAILVFVQVRLAEIVIYPPIAWLGKLPTYNSSEWVNLSRHKYDGLIGYDLLWCWYCDWMTGIWSLGSEMLRNIESFWCPIQFQSPMKNQNASIDFPDLSTWVPFDGTMEDAVAAFEKHYDGKKPNRWWGHPDRQKEK
jgi:hypothetical protein